MPRIVAGASRGFVGWLVGDHLAAESFCLAALASFRQAQNLQEVAETLVNLGASALYNDQLEIAGDRLEEALAIARRLGFQEGIAWSLHELAILARHRHRPTREPALMLRDALLVHSQLGDRWRVASVLEEIAGSLLLREDPHVAVELLAYAESLREQLQTPVPPVEAPARAATLARLEVKLSRSSFASAWSEGRELQLPQAVDHALHLIERLVASARDAPPTTIDTDPDAAGVGCPPAPQRRSDQPRDCHGPLYERQHCGRSCLQHSAKARRQTARRRRRLGLLARAAASRLSALGR